MEKSSQFIENHTLKIKETEQEQELLEKEKEYLQRVFNTMDFCREKIIEQFKHGVDTEILLKCTVSCDEFENETFSLLSNNEQCFDKKTLNKYLKHHFYKVSWCNDNKTQNKFIIKISMETNPQ